MGEQYQSVRDIPIPDNLSHIERAEYTAYLNTLADLEDEWNKLQNGENEDQLTCISMIEEMKNRRIDQSNERLKLKLEIIEKQYEREREKILADKEEYQKQLFDRLLKAYYQSYNNISSQLKDLMGKDHIEFLAQHQISFPQFTESTMRTRVQQPEEVRPKLTPAECEADIRAIQSLINSMNPK